MLPASVAAAPRGRPARSSGVLRESRPMMDCSSSAGPTRGDCPAHAVLGKATRVVSYARLLVSDRFELRPRDQVGVSVYGCHPPLEHHVTWACHSEPIAIPRGRRGVSGQGAVRAVVVDEVLKVGEEVHWVHEMSSSVSTTDQPSFLKEGSRRWRRSARRLSTPATVSWAARRSPSRLARRPLQRARPFRAVVTPR